MPQTLSSTSMFTPCGFSPHHLHPTKQSDEGELIFQDGNLTSASLDALIQHLIPTADYYPEKAYIFTFLLSSRLFIEPHELLSRVCHKCIEQQQLDDPVLDKARIRKFGPKILQLLTEWTETFPYDFKEERMIGCLKDIIHRIAPCDEGSVLSPMLFNIYMKLLGEIIRRFGAGCYQYADDTQIYFSMSTSSGGGITSLNACLEVVMSWMRDNKLRLNPDKMETYWKKMNQLLQALNQKLATLNHGQEGIVKISATVSDKVVAFKSKPPSIQKEMLSVCSDPYTLAQQLTHVELERLSHIGPEEFVQAFVHKDPLESTKPCFSEQKKTSNLEAYVKWFNRLCYLVATEICMPAKKKQRAQVIEFFIDVARECFNIGNFNSLMAIISGMNMSPVSRLKKTWSKVKTAKFFILEHQMDPTGNFYNYRTALRGAAHRSLTAHSNREKIVIPFFSLLIKDIYFLNEGCANRLPNGHVNFEKFLELAKQVGEFITWKQVECPFERDDNIIHYLHTAPIFTEDGLYLASYESESPENQTEKERWKTLRSTILGKT
ncbi:ras-GEF domain-containing family member 1C isoform X2 [Hemicordylus capensis]|nr:ras-GEF domain-containing family member 1C isoform X2 [Hemicordylus capensis]